jgi:hypothetical protein
MLERKQSSVICFPLLAADLVKELGGDEEDFQLLQGMESDAKQGNKELVAFTDTDQKELKNLIKSLNLTKFSSVTVVPDNKEEKTIGEDVANLVATAAKKDKKKKVTDDKRQESPKKLQDSEVSSTTTAAAAPEAPDDEPVRSGPDFYFIKTTPNRGHCVIRPNEKWYAAVAAAEQAASSAVAEKTVNLTYWLPKIEKYAQQAWDLEIKNYEEARKKGTSTQQS